MQRYVLPVNNCTVSLNNAFWTLCVRRLSFHYHKKERMLAYIHRYCRNLLEQKHAPEGLMNLHHCIYVLVTSSILFVSSRQQRSRVVVLWFLAMWHSLPACMRMKVAMSMRRRRCLWSCSGRVDVIQLRSRVSSSLPTL